MLKGEWSYIENKRDTLEDENQTQEDKVRECVRFKYPTGIGVF